MRTRELIFRVLQFLSINSDDSIQDFSEEYIYNVLIDKRAFLLKQHYKDARKSVPRSCYQTLNVPLEKIRVVPDLKYSEVLLRSVDKIPEMVDFAQEAGVATTIIMSTDYTAIPFNLVTFERLPSVGSNRWTKDLLYAALGNERLYLKSFNSSFINLTKVLIFGVFSDPSQVYYANGNEGDYYEEEFPINNSMVDPIIKLTLEELTRIQRPKDVVNDGEGIEDQRSRV
mgnify:FL=1|jgi:hypothetical protein